ncbi:MT-A70 family methyltransferase [Bosea sp. (in: a-proteobacteria)]
MAELIPLARIRRDGGTQPRAALDAATVETYADTLVEGGKLPPVGLTYDGTDYWLWDGFHRAAAHERAGRAAIEADVTSGTRRDAVLLAVGANATHGLRRTTEDKRRAVMILLGDDEWGYWSDHEIARRAHVSQPFVGKMRVLTNNVISERAFATKHGTVAKMDTAAIGKRAADVATLKSVDPGALYQVIRERHTARQEEKKVRRDEREAELAERIAAGNAALTEAAEQGRTYGVIYADPEWRFEPRSRETGMDRAAENHYPTSPTADICARPVGALAARDSVLFLWATAPMLPDAFRVMEAWGFTYKTHAVWAKRRPGRQRGPGYWLTGEHEVLMLGVRGNPPAPAPGAQWPSFFVAPIGEHSEKPARAYELIEAYFPTLPKIELNARRRRAGWDVWGAEVPDAEPVEPMGRPDPSEMDGFAAPDVVELPTLPRGRRRAA